MLVYDGYRYTINQAGNKSIFWRCNLFKKYKCKARAVTPRQQTLEQSIRLMHTHSHPRE